MDAQALLREIDGDRAAHIRFLREFVQAPSPNPPGDTRDAAAVIVAYLRRSGVEPETVAPRPHMPNIVSDFECGAGPAGAGSSATPDPEDAKGKRLIMNGHIDVFPVAAGPTEHTDDKGFGDGDGVYPGWKHGGPWSGHLDESEGRLYGRGVVDMKAGTAASAIAFTYLHKYRDQLRRGGSVGLCAVSDEETGGRWGSRYLLEHPSQADRWKGDCMINAEPGGLGTIRFAEKGTLRLTFEVRARGCHGAYLHLSEGAVRIAARLIGELVAAVEGIEPAIDPGLKAQMESGEVRDAIDAAMGRSAADIALRPTVNIGTIRGGVKVNMIPDNCEFEADVRLPIGLGREAVMEVINGVVAANSGAAVTVQEAASNPAATCAHDHPMVGPLARHARAVMMESKKGEERGPVAIPSLGATDCKFWRYHGVPAYVFGVSPEGMASTNESVLVEEFLAVVKTHALAAWEYLGGKP